ncbi:MAG TPA: cytochrome c oxidase subunit II [Pirellulales bacterium]|jgi:cytochrome c oxidase subunit 2|nr:cytochrome c oxidase subunit II [Pirellulales bacterium]
MPGALLLAAADAATQNASIFSPASPPAQSIHNLAILIFAITGFIFVVVETVLFYSIFRFRRRKSDVATSEPPQLYGSAPIEIAWTAAPLLIVVVIVLVCARTLWEVDLPAPQPQPGDSTLFVTVVGRQWWWEYTYDTYDGKPLGIVTANELHIPVSEKGTPRRVFLTLKSADVYHSFWVPRLAGKTALVPGQINSMWFSADQPGLFVGQCAEYCGTQHANMLQRVVVDSPHAFQEWLDAQQKPAAENPPDADGKAMFLSLSCVNCHRIRGTMARGSYAPDLTHLMSRKTLASGMIANDPEGVQLRKWIADPQAIKPGCLMPAFGLSDRQLALVVAYLRGLK